LAALAAGTPTIVMGDINSDEDSPALKLLLTGDGDGGLRLADSYRRVHPTRKGNEASFHDWEGITAGVRIDFILFGPDFQSRRQTSFTRRTTAAGRRITIR
jgi:endonuclease/exonuclease/phosphatase family metal-dependent hydrolase